MAQTLERWRERPEYRRLCELAAERAAGARPARPARNCVRRSLDLLDPELRRRLDVLIEKARAQPLDESEKLELQALTVAQSRVGAPMTAPEH